MDQYICGVAGTDYHSVVAVRLGRNALPRLASERSEHHSDSHHAGARKQYRHNIYARRKIRKFQRSADKSESYRRAHGTHRNYARVAHGGILPEHLIGPRQREHAGIYNGKHDHTQPKAAAGDFFRKCFNPKFVSHPYGKHDRKYQHSHIKKIQKRHYQIALFQSCPSVSHLLIIGLIIC